MQHVVVGKKIPGSGSRSQEKDLGWESLSESRQQCNGLLKIAADPDPQRRQAAKCCRVPKWWQAAGPESSQSQAETAHETTQQVSEGGWSPVAVGKRQMDRHTMQSEIGYLFSGYGREGRRGE